MKESQLSVLITLISLFVVNNGVFVKSLDIMMTSPEISIGGWMENDFESSREWHTDSNPPLGDAKGFRDTIVVPNSVRGLSLVCNASYPVEWRFHRERWGGRSRLQYALQTTRIADGIDVKRFSSELSFFSFESNSVTGNYTCQKVGYPGLSQSLYIFWEGASPPFLTLARSYRKPPTVPFRNDSVSFTLPCTVSVPTMVPRLVKEVGTTEVPIKKNSSVQYDPRVGFTLINLPNPYGRYTCHGGDADDDNNEGDADLITFNVVDADDGPKPEFNETIKHGAFYNINSTSRELTCCSAGQKPPKLKLVECDHPTICTLAKHTLHTMESAKKRNLGCSIIPLRILRAGVFRCVGAGIDVVREFFYPIPEVPQSPWRRGGKPGGKGGKGGGGWGGKNKQGNANGTGMLTLTPVAATTDDPYFDWNEADPLKMMMVTKLKGPVYIGQNRTFSCRVSHFYYGQGLVWALEFANQTAIQYINGREGRKQHQGHWVTNIRHFEILLGKNQQFLDLVITADLLNITCYAPVWNSTEWHKKSINLVVKQPTAPKLVGKAHKEYSWYLNDTKKTLECEFTGEPMPKVLWKKGNTTFAMNTNTENGTSTVTFPKVALDSDDTYECIISNEAGTISKTFKVTVVHSISSSISAILILSLVGFIVVSIVAGFMFKYLKSQNNVINHLANLAFKDVTSGGEGSSSTNTTSTPATTNRSAISVDTNGVILPSLSSPSAPQQIPSISSSSTISPTDHLSKFNGGGGGGGGRPNSGFVFDYSTPAQTDPERPSSPQPPLSSFSSYHKF